MFNYDTKIINEIYINDFENSRKKSKSIRELIVDKFMNLSGNIDNPEHHLIYESLCSNFEIYVEKPGKEARRKTNINHYDLRIYIKKNNKEIDIGKSFTNIFKSFESIKSNGEPLDLMAYIFIRNAYCYDHNNSYEYSPSKIIINQIKKNLNEIHDVPIDVFLQFIDLISTNEDVKYANKSDEHGNKKYSLGQGTGRRNNLLTYVHVIAFLQNKILASDLIGSLVSGAPGVAPIDSKSLIEHFPLVKGKYEL